MVDSVLGRLLEVAVEIFEDPVVHVPDGEKKLLTQHNIRLKDKEASLFNEQNLFTTLEYLIFVGIHQKLYVLQKKNCTNVLKSQVV